MRLADADRQILRELRVLYVEDEDEVREQMAMLLGRWLARLDLAENGAAGLARFRAWRPDVVITDIQMPEMNGLEMAAAIKEEAPGTPIIVTTAFNETQHFMRAIEIGIDHYIGKPVNSRTLLETLMRTASVLFQRRELDRTYTELMAYRQRAEEELALAHYVMQRMIDAEGLRDPSLLHWSRPAEQFNGDTVAAARCPGGSLFVLLADAIGHGLPAAMNLLPLIRVFYRMTEKGFSLPSMVAELNASLRLHAPTDRFVAAALVRVDRRNRMAEVWNGGIPYVALLDAGGRVRQRIDSDNPPLGIMPPEQLDLGTLVVRWEEDSELVLASDGILEARSPADELFEAESLDRVLAAHPRSQRVEGLVAALRAFSGGEAHDDDQSFISIHCPA